MRMYIKSVVVDDQSKALEFYTEKLGFIKKHDIPVGPYRWLTLVSPEEEDGVELALEPDAHEMSKQFQKAIFEDGIPFTSFQVDDIQAEYENLKAKGVIFTQPPTDVESAWIATLDDTCGNLIQIIQMS